MFQYHCLNPIAEVGTSKLTDQYSVTSNVNEADAILVRSASMHDMDFSPKLKAIARAGAGVNNIPLDEAASHGVVVFNTPGVNANGVKELVIAGMLLAARDIVPGIQWVQDFVDDDSLTSGSSDAADIAKVTEKKKSAFAGTELEGKKLGVIGLGAIGVLVANAATHLGMEVYGYDPYVSVESAWKLSRSIRPTASLDEIYKECDYISVHVPALKDTKHMINNDAISLMKSNVVILNFSRDALVNEEDMVDALLMKKVHRYVTDFPTPTIAGVQGAIVIPHLGASTEESEDNCAKMAVKQVRDYLENGNIKNSVNYPDSDMGLKGEGDRITILHRNFPNMLGQFTNLLANANINIPNMTNKSRGAFAYTILDIEDKLAPEIEEKLTQIEGVLRVRVIV